VAGANPVVICFFWLGFVGMMPQLVMQKPTTAATFQIAFAALGIPLIDVSFVLDQFHGPRCFAADDTPRM